MLWGMMMLVLLTKPIDDSSSSRPLALVNSQYEFLLHRRLQWMFLKKQEYPNWESRHSDVTFSQVMAIVQVPML
jgi:hypothetical protein